MTGKSGLLRVGVIGVGLMGAHHFERLTTRIHGADVVAVSDYDGDKARQFASRTPSGQAFADPIELISSDSVDAVLIASPGSVHEEQLLACIEARKPVLCEKPLTMDSESAYRVVKAELATGRRLISLGFMRRYDPEYRTVHGMLESGQLGAPLMLHSTIRVQEVPASFVTEMIVGDSIVHDIDVTRWMLGEEVDTFTIHRPASTSYRSSPDLADPLFVVMQMASGRLSTVSILVNSRCGYQIRLEAVGETGSAQLGNDIGVVTAMSDLRWGGPIATDFRVRFEAAYDAELQDWVSSVLAGQATEAATAWDGYAATATSEAGLLALHSGTPQRVSLRERPA